MPLYTHEARRFMAGENGLVSLTAATATLDADTHAGAVCVLNRAAGITVTLPAATGTGNLYTIVVGTTVTSNDYIVQVANATDVINGAVALSTDIAGVTISAGASDDTITMNGTTKGGISGSLLEIRDVASGKFVVTGSLVSSGTEADPFSAAVS